MKWSDCWLLCLIYLPRFVESSFLNFGGGACGCSRPCPPPPVCPSCPSPCASYPSAYRQSYSPSYYAPSYVAYPATSGYYPSGGYVAAYPAGYAETSPTYIPSVGAGGSYSAVPTITSLSSSSYSVPASYYAQPSSSFSYPSVSSYAAPSASYAVPSATPSSGPQTESGGYVYPHPNQTPNTISPFASIPANSHYTYTPVWNKSYYNSGTATVNPQTSFADAEVEDTDEETKEKLKPMPFADVSYKSKELMPERQMRQLSAPSIETVAYEAPSVCNNHTLGEVMLKAMVADISISKRLVRSATELAFHGKKFDVFCATGDFSYSIYAEQYCEATSGNVTCFAFY